MYKFVLVIIFVLAGNAGISLLLSYRTCVRYLNVYYMDSSHQVRNDAI